MNIDEAIEFSRYKCSQYDSFIIGYEYDAEEHNQIAKWLEELKSYQQLDLEIPQHFTKEQSAWIKKYCIEKNKEFYNKGIDDFCEAMDNELFSTEWVKIIYHTIAEKLKVGGKNEID